MRDVERLYLDVDSRSRRRRASAELTSCEPTGAWCDVLRVERLERRSSSVGASVGEWAARAASSPRHRLGLRPRRSRRVGESDAREYRALEWSSAAGRTSASRGSRPRRGEGASADGADERTAAFRDLLAATASTATATNAMDSRAAMPSRRARGSACTARRQARDDRGRWFGVMRAIDVHPSRVSVAPVSNPRTGGGVGMCAGGQFVPAIRRGGAGDCHKCDRFSVTANSVLAAGGTESDVDRVFQPVVDERNATVAHVDAVDDIETAWPSPASASLSTAIRYCVSPNRYAVNGLPSRSAGTQGAMCSRSASRRSPSSDSTISRYSQPAEPVYQVQPPRPACGGDGIDVGGDDIGFDLVGGDGFRRARMVDRVDQRQQVPCAAAVAERGERHRRPDSGMRVLAAVLAHARDIAFDVAGIRARTCRMADRAAGPVPIRAARGARSSASIARRERARYRPRRTAPTSSARWNRSSIPD